MWQPRTVPANSKILQWSQYDIHIELTCRDAYTKFLKFIHGYFAFLYAIVLWRNQH
jgi:hypothetical protein